MTDYLSYQPDFSRPEVVAVYDELPLWSAMFGQLLLQHVPLRRGLTVLDLGYGTGFPLLELAERLGASCKVYGVDPWEAARRRAEDKARLWQVSNVELLPGDAAALPFPDATFDLIVSNLGINNFGDVPAAFRECFRVAKPGARLALTTNLQGHMGEFYAVFESTLRQLGRAALLPALDAHIAHRASVAGLTARMEQSGFQVSAVHQQSTALRFVDGSAFLRHHLIKQGFLDAWKDLLEPGEQPAVFACLESNLNQVAEKQGELVMTIPMAYMEGEKIIRFLPPR